MRRIGFLLLTCLFAVAPRDASASLVVGSGLIYDESPFFRWEYDLGIEPDQEIRAGAQFTVYDFAGFVIGSDKASQTALFDADTPFPEPEQEWEFSYAFLGGTPDVGALAGDNGALFNLTWTYRGTDTIVGDDEVQSTIGYFSAQSIYDVDTVTVDWFAAQAYPRTEENELPSEVLIFNAAEAVLVPSVPDGPAPIPEPGSMFLVGTGLLGVFRAMKRRAT